MKKNLALLLALLMIFCTLAACNPAAETTEPGESVVSDTTGSGTTAPGVTGTSVDYDNQLIIGSTTQINADMYDAWSNGAMNAGIYQLVSGGLSTMQWTSNGEYVENPTVLDGSIGISDDAAGNRVYTIKINSNLVYNDGSPISAKDFVFALLLENSPEFGEQDSAFNANADRLLGFAGYNAGETKIFSGVRLLGEYEFAAIIAAENMPYHFEFYDMVYRPLPMAVIAPGCDIADDGAGAYIAGEFTAALLTETILDPVNGYRFNPKVTPGPYQFVSYDSSTYETILEINPNYPGTYLGTQPSIQKLILRQTTAATEMEELAAGTVDLLSGIGTGTTIDAGLDMVDEGTLNYLEYGRNGYGAVFFHGDFGPTQYEEVRRAIAWLLNRDDFAIAFTGGYGVTVDTYAGYGQKEFMDNKDYLDSALTHYTLDPAKAIAELEAGGWTLDKDGNAYDAGKGTADDGNIRYKKLNDGTLMPLIIEWISSENNEVSDLLIANLPPEATKVGMKINQTVSDFNTLLLHYYAESNLDPSERKYSMFNLATNFATISPYWFYFSQDPAYFGGSYNTVRSTDRELTDIANAMQSIPYSDEAAWNDAWLKLVTRWNEVLPALPLYSNMYHTFFNPKLENHVEHSTFAWYYGIVDANIAGH